MDAFEQWVRGGLDLAGIDFEPAEIDIMRFVEAVYGEEIAALEAADLAHVWPEPDLDPGRAPTNPA